MIARRILDVCRDDAEQCVGADIPVSVSIGVAQWTGQETVEKLLARADAALYTAKRSGRNQVVAASSSDAIELAAAESRRPAGRVATSSRR